MNLNMFYLKFVKHVVFPLKILSAPKVRVVGGLNSFRRVQKIHISYSYGNRTRKFGKP